MSKDLSAAAKRLILRGGVHAVGRDAAVGFVVDARRGENDSSRASFSAEALFAVSPEPVLIVDAATEAIVELNPAAADLLDGARDALLGAAFLSVFERSSSTAIQRSLNIACSASGHTHPELVRTLKGGNPLEVTMSSFRVDPHTYLLVHLNSNFSVGLGDREDVPSAVFDSIDAASLGFLITDAGFLVEYANRAFVELVDLDSQEAVRGQSLGRWLEWSEADSKLLQDQMIQRRATSVLAAKLHGRRGSWRGVELCAVAVPDSKNSCWGFTVRELPRLN